ncbi:helix-turn-helix domain-containing protein [Microbacterium testaceum]|uniref:helix-turn-helix domain-containing protein n=1 Tax=Microbacterium testaceum TaxID=2033 RepID=UPI0009C09FD1
MRESRTRAGLTQEAVARKAEVSLNTVRNVESGQCVEPGYFTIIAIAEALEMEVAGVTLTSPGAP